MVTVHTDIRNKIKAANAVFIRVQNIEWDVKISKSEARKFITQCERSNVPVEADFYSNPQGNVNRDLYLSAESDFHTSC